MDKLERILRIYERVTNRNLDRPKKKDIFSYLGMDSSYERTFRRDLNELYDVFGISIKPVEGYRYEVVTDPGDYGDNLLTLLNGLRFQTLINGFKGDAVDFKDYVVVSNPSGVGGEWLQTLFEHISSNEVIEMTHQSYRREDAKTYILHPYQLREHDQRWYLVAWKPADTEFRTFGLDRIKEIKGTGKKFKPSKRDEILRIFRNNIGMWGSENNPVEIKIWFDHLAKNYIKSNKWHWSQEVLEEDNDGVLVRWNVTISYELLRLLMSWSGQFKVIQPPELTEKIKELASKTLDLNK